MEEPMISHHESDEEDCEGYFLKTTADAYDIKEKIKSANEELFEEYNSENDFREPKVTFNDALDYEPYYSSDDGYVQSPYALESDHEDIENENELSVCQPIKEEELIEEIQEISLNNSEEIEQQEEEEIIEELSDDSKTEGNVIELIQDSEIVDETDLEISIIHCDEDSPKFPSKKPKCKGQTQMINCRLHCLEKQDLDLINKGCETPIKVSKELTLKLKPKKCCTNQERSKLPNYNGLKSEYGLTEKQIQRKRLKCERELQRKRESILRQREEKLQKELYNEEIFVSWLKSVEQRYKKNNKNQYLTYDQRRPKTAEVKTNVSNNKKNRPHSTLGKVKNNTIILYPGVTMRTNI